MVDVVVIGSNSFSGSHFVSCCLDKGMDVAGISRSEEPIDAFLPYRWKKYGGEFSFYRYDLNQHLEEITELIKRLCSIITRRCSTKE